MTDKVSDELITADARRHGHPLAAAGLANTLIVVMAIGTVVWLGLLLNTMLRQPFEATDDLIWLAKLRNDRFLDLPLSPAWMLQSPFYRPVAEFLLKCLYALFGLDPTPYRYVQFAIFLLLMGLSLQVVRRLGLRPESVLLITVFAIGSPFISGSVVWISELPHVLVLVCFAASLLSVLSDNTDRVKLALCGLAYAIALLSKENGLFLIAFYIYFLRTAPLRAAIVFGGITLAYFAMRAVVLGSGMGTAGVDESVGYFFQMLSKEERLTLFSGHAVYKLYVYNVLAQLGALAFRITQWGVIFDRPHYQIIVETLSTALIVAGLVALRGRPQRHTLVVVVIAAIAIGGPLLSYSYARDRHLALPAFAYAFLLAIAVNELASFLPGRPRPTALIACVWVAWSLQAGLMLRQINWASGDVIERVYRANEKPFNPTLPPDVWATAREHALSLAPPSRQ
ncbi:hypothetical protein ACVIW2_008624 [Bradyrhizobium huanghuaihaiense]|uniref:Glycosyltransferase RgtA/B/C/D-like domain-containing protein n=1 Tax=Bradyrhizobium huanghuaihaiense TaxID=990078 RepID=A0A562R0X5_9BRAD|nr:hypothetical protein [Bradyrhizobium huanghuaihaiense]TWI62719.1 hypothetical protein IQ16_06467 [Bradyrhizobium huanghuaihaiense]